MFGIASPGRTACGERIHSAMFAGVFGRVPARIAWPPTWSSGGPTCPRAPVTPGITWQTPQPDRAITVGAVARIVAQRVFRRLPSAGGDEQQGEGEGG